MPAEFGGIRNAWSLKPDARVAARSANVPVRVGYTAGVFDMLNVGHVRLIERARALCDFLVVGVSTDVLCQQLKGAPPRIPFPERMLIVQSIRHVDSVVPQTSLDKLAMWEVLRFDVLFVGDAVRDDVFWINVAARLAHVGAAVTYLPATYTSDGALLERYADESPQD